MDEPDTSSVPAVAVPISLDPQVYNPSDTDVPVLSVTTTLQTTIRPITLFSWCSILNPKLDLSQEVFEIIDEFTSEPIPQGSIKIKREAFRWQLGCSDEKYFITLVPDVLHTIQTPFGVKPQLDTDRHFERGVHGVRSLKAEKCVLRVGDKETKVY